jgi:hypothetical protein
MTVPGQVHDITGSMTSPTDVTPLQDRIHGGVT